MNESAVRRGCTYAENREREEVQHMLHHARLLLLLLFTVNRAVT